jgi:1-pyrroline-5-carboxylate dehydrogenase
MPFENERTFQKFVTSKEVESFHDKYEQAIRDVKREFGRHYPLIIGGKKIKKDSTFTHLSPVDTRIALGYFSISSPKDTRNAINAAKDSFKKWREYDCKKRIEICRAAGDILSERKFELAAWLSYENGKNRYEAIADVDEAIDFIRYYCESMVANKGFSTLTCNAYHTESSRSIMKPYGVWGVIAPFNFPAAILIGMSSGALITGNTIVLKPPSDAPVIGYKFAQVMDEAGLPNGVLNLITGPGAQLGREIVENENVAGIVFTGSMKVGYELIRRFNRAKTRPIIAELGGKNPAIVTESADLDEAVQGISNAAFGYSGQKCSACSMVYVQKTIKKEFVEKLVKKSKSLKVGNPLEPSSFVGPLINSYAYENYQRYTMQASQDGKLLVGGRINKFGDLKYGLYAEPTIIDGLPEGHRLLTDELFLPILCLVEYASLEDALRSCNSSEYGLTAGIYTKKKKDVKKFIEGIESGVVYVNRALSATTGAMVGCQSFVGWKRSGTTGKGTGGPYYLTQFMQEQSQTFANTKYEDG